LSEAVLPPKGILLILLVSVIGIALLWRRRGRALGVLFAVPLLLFAVVALLSHWSLDSARLVGLAPYIILTLVAGVALLIEMLPARAQAPVLGVAGVLLIVPGCLLDAHYARTPWRPDDVAHLFPLLHDYLAKRPNDPTLVYLMGHGAPFWLFYETDWRAPRTPAFEALAKRVGPMARDTDRLCVMYRPNVRVVFGPTAPQAFELPALTAEAEWLGTQPERQMWMMTTRYDHANSHTVRFRMEQLGSKHVIERYRQDAELLNYQWPPATSPPAPPMNCVPLAGASDQQSASTR
jgi:hypothetical protein